LDFGPPVEPAGAPSRRRNRRWWYVLAAILIIATAFVVARQHGRKPAAAPSRPATPTATRTLTTPTRPPVVSASPTVAPVAVTTLGRPLLDVPAGWELFGRTSEGVVRIELARGRITQTAMPPLDSGGGVSFLVGPDRAIVRPWDVVPGYVAPDARAARPLPDALGSGGPALPGPDPQHFWVQGGSNSHPVMQLVDFNGLRVASSISLPSNTGPASSDERGYMVFTGIGGVYDVGPSGVQRVSTGQLLAVGRTRWLTLDCDDHYHCERTVTDRATGARHTLGLGSTVGFPSDGVISPDGSRAAIVDMGLSGDPTVHLIDLATGQDRATGVSLDTQQAFAGGTFVWAPDSASLFVAASSGRLLIIDPRTARVSSLGTSLPLITQLALRVS
jgi:hypothetical protein